MSYTAQRATSVLDKLSDREVAVFVRIARGTSLHDIGIDMGLAESTVSTYRGRLCRKLGLTRTVELVLLAHRLGLPTFRTPTR